MADVNLPSITELSQMASLPFAQYQTAQQNINLANQFQKQNLDQGEATLQKSLMDNLFQQQNDPTRLQNNRGIADISTAEAILKGADAKVRQTFLPEEIEAKRDAFVKAQNETKLANMYSKAERDYLDPASTDEVRAAAKEAMGRTSKELFERNKAKDALDKQREEYTAKGGIADKEIAGRQTVAEIAAGSREKVQGMKQKQQDSYSQALQKAPNYEKAANIAEAFAAASEDPNSIAYYQKEAERFRAQGVASKAAGAGVTATTKLDMPTAATTGVIQNQPNPVPAVPAPTARPGSFVPGARGDIPSGGSPTQVSPSQQRSANDAALEVKQREFNNAVARGDMQLAQSLQKEMEASVQGKGPLNSGGVTKAQPTIRDDGKVNVVRPDGKAGWISKSDLDEAIKNGWKIK